MQRRSRFADLLAGFPGLAFGDEAIYQHRGQWREHFRRRIGPSFDGRLIFEIGCSDAAFLARVAAKFPRTAFVGLDWKFKSLYLGAKRVAELGLENIALLRGRAQVLLRVFADGEADEIWVFHPDPCDEPKDLPQRLIAEPFLLDVHRALSTAGSLMLKTDHPGYFQWTLALLGLPEPRDFGKTNLRTKVRELMLAHELPPASQALKTQFQSVVSADFWKDPAILQHTTDRSFAGERTDFERRFSEKNRPIYFVELRKSWQGNGPVPLQSLS